ncbi:MAG: hypothetical protein QM783_02535 [Phycisphaerales bacterium]
MPGTAPGTNRPVKTSRLSMSWSICVRLLTHDHATAAAAINDSAITAYPSHDLTRRHRMRQGRPVSLPIGSI